MIGNPITPGVRTVDKDYESLPQWWKDKFAQARAYATIFVAREGQPPYEPRDLTQAWLDGVHTGLGYTNPDNLGDWMQTVEIARHIMASSDVEDRMARAATAVKRNPNDLAELIYALAMVSWEEKP